MTAVVLAPWIVIVCVLAGAVALCRLAIWRVNVYFDHEQADRYMRDDHPKHIVRGMTASNGPFIPPDSEGSFE